MRVKMINTCVLNGCEYRAGLVFNLDLETGKEFVSKWPLDGWFEDQELPKNEKEQEKICSKLIEEEEYHA